MKTAAALHDASEGSKGLDIEREKGKSLVDGLKAMRRNLKRSRKADATDVETESTVEKATQDTIDDDVLDVQDSPVDRLKLIKRYAEFVQKRKEIKVDDKVATEISTGSTMEIDAGTNVVVEKGGDLTVLGQLKAPKGSVVEVTAGATIDLRSTDGDGAEDEAVDTVPVIGGKLEAKGKGARIQLDDVKLEADGTLSTQKEGTLVFARSKKNKHRRRGQKKHTIQLGGSFADLSTTDATKIKEGKKELRDKTDVEEELTKEDDSTDDSAQEMTVTNLQRMLKARGVLPADGSGDSSCDTVQKATRKMAKYVRAKKKVLPMLRRSKTITKSKGQVFDEADVTKALQETESTDEGKALAASKSTRWERYKSLAEKG